MGGRCWFFYLGYFGLWFSIGFLGIFRFWEVEGNGVFIFSRCVFGDFITELGFFFFRMFFVLWGYGFVFGVVDLY